MKKFKEFSIPGIYHDLKVRLTTRKTVAKLAKDKDTLAFYEHQKSRITLGKDLETQVKIHTLYHEISHHILDTLECIEDEEAKCDLLGSYLMRLVAIHDLIESDIEDKPK